MLVNRLLESSIIDNNRAQKFNTAQSLIPFGLMGNSADVPESSTSYT